MQSYAFFNSAEGDLHLLNITMLSLSASVPEQSFRPESLHDCARRDVRRCQYQQRKCSTTSPSDFDEDHVGTPNGISVIEFENPNVTPGARTIICLPVIYGRPIRLCRAVRFNASPSLSYRSRTTFASPVRRIICQSCS